jgi:nitroreductase
MPPTKSRPATGKARSEDSISDPCQARHFFPDPVTRTDIEHMVGVATRAVSACDSQTWQFIAIEDRDVVGRMQQAILTRFDELAQRPGLALQERKRMVARAQALAFSKAPLCMAVLALPSSSPAEELMLLSGLAQEELDRMCVRPELQGVGAAVQLLATSAHALGYAVCWTCAPILAADKLEEILDVRSPARLVALIGLGRPTEMPTVGRHLSLEQVLSYR